MKLTEFKEELMSIHSIIFGECFLVPIKVKRGVEKTSNGGSIRERKILEVLGRGDDLPQGRGELGEGRGGEDWCGGLEAARRVEGAVGEGSEYIRLAQIELRGNQTIDVRVVHPEAFRTGFKGLSRRSQVRLQNTGIYSIKVNYTLTRQFLNIYRCSCGIWKTVQ